MVAMVPALASMGDAVGSTPLVALSRIGRELAGPLIAKCEFLNPGGSIKDRIATYMIVQAERRGLLRRGGTIIEMSSGNTGVSLAIAAAPRGYRTHIVCTAKISPDKVRLMRAHGAAVTIVPAGLPAEHAGSAVATTRRLAATLPGAWFADQFRNPDNWRAHYLFTGPEIWRQTGGRIDTLVAGIGTGGTLRGIARYLKERRPQIRIVLADPEGSVLADRFAGRTTTARPFLTEGVGNDEVPPLAALDDVDSAITIDDAEMVSTCDRLRRMEGLFVGSSSGCIVAAALRHAGKSADGGTVLAILPDGGSSYLSTVYNPLWRRQHGLPPSEASS